MHRLDKSDMPPFGEVLDAFIESTGQSKKRFAFQVGCHWRTLDRYINAETAIDILSLRMLLAMAPSEWRVKLIRAAFGGLGIDFESSEPICMKFLDANGDGDHDHEDVAIHLVRATLGTADAQMAATLPNVTHFDLADKRDLVERHMDAAIAIQAGA
jgi:hypothetical protein